MQFQRNQPERLRAVAFQCILELKNLGEVSLGGNSSVEFEDECRVKRRLTSRTTVTRLLEQAEHPESKKLKTGEIVAMIDGCTHATASEKVEKMGQNIAMAEPMRTPEGIPRSRKTEIDKRMERGFVERWSRTEALKTGVPICRSSLVGDPFSEKSRYALCQYATHKAPREFAAASDAVDRY